MVVLESGTDVDNRVFRASSGHQVRNRAFPQRPPVTFLGTQQDRSRDVSGNLTVMRSVATQVSENDRSRDSL